MNIQFNLKKTLKTPIKKQFQKYQKFLSKQFLVSVSIFTKIINGEIYLGQGGNQFKKSDQYELFEKGEKTWILIQMKL